MKDVTDSLAFEYGQFCLRNVSLGNGSQNKKTTFQLKLDTAKSHHSAEFNSLLYTLLNLYSPTPKQTSALS